MGNAKLSGDSRKARTQPSSSVHKKSLKYWNQGKEMQRKKTRLKAQQPNPKQRLTEKIGNPGKNWGKEENYEPFHRTTPRKQ